MSQEIGNNVSLKYSKFANRYSSTVFQKPLNLLYSITGDKSKNFLDNAITFAQKNPKNCKIITPFLESSVLDELDINEAYKKICLRRITKSGKSITTYNRIGLAERIQKFWKDINIDYNISKNTFGVRDLLSKQRYEFKKIPSDFKELLQTMRKVLKTIEISRNDLLKIVK